MSVMNEIIYRFIKQQTCATICCTDEQGIPYCFCCYYVVKPKTGLFYFKSSDNAYHTSLLAINPIVAGTILPDKLSKLITKGIQWRGELLEEHHPQTKDADEIYHKKSVGIGRKGNSIYYSSEYNKDDRQSIWLRKKEYLEKR